jgi:hypothetical protein
MNDLFQYGLGQESMEVAWPDHRAVLRWRCYDVIADSINNVGSHSQSPVSLISS